MHYKNIIIGAGPAGLQCAYFFKKHNIEYIVLERNKLCASFFDKYPHSGKLISINKKYTGSTSKNFNLRHDWNSLLNDDNLLFTNYSDDYYPNKTDLVRYMNDFYKHYKLNILFDMDVNLIKKKDDKYIIYVNDEEYSCDKLIIATGLSKPWYPYLKTKVHDDLKHYYDYPKDYFLDKTNLKEFINKRVLIYGGGNSAYELGNLLTSYASHIILEGRNIKEWALSSHYSGDLRSIYLPYMDTFLLKSLNGINYDNTKQRTIVQDEKDGMYNVYSDDNLDKVDYTVDKIIICTGWAMDKSIFDFPVELLYEKYPKLEINYESVNNKNLYFIGSLMHGDDYKISSGGFIHGFRYLIDFFVKVNYLKLKEFQFKLKKFDDIDFFATIIMDRINNSSELYQMFGYLVDIFYLDREMGNVTLVKNTRRKMHDKNIKHDMYFIVSLEYGKVKIKQYDNLGLKFSKVGTESYSSLLHPIIYVYNNGNEHPVEIMHLDENLIAEFYEQDVYYDRIVRLIKSYL